MKLKSLTLILVLLFPSLSVIGQAILPSYQIPTSVPFLTIAPDARSAAMGDAGIANEPDANSQFWNPATMAMVKHKTGFSISYTPWARALIPEIFLLNASGYFRLNERHVFSSSFRYFNLGAIQFGSNIYNPFELAADLGYAIRFSKHFSGGISLRYIQSNITEGTTTPSGKKTIPGRSFAGDLGIYYENVFDALEREITWALGMNLSNLGSPIAYSEDAAGVPIPSKLGLGGRISANIATDHHISILIDLHKLLVPTPPIWEEDTLTGEPVVVRGKQTPHNVVRGMFQSLFDAPGFEKPDGSYSIMQEELAEIRIGTGMEYGYKAKYFLRAGYCYEHAAKGYRRYFTVGAGIGISNFQVDASFLIYTSQSEYLRNTFRITLSAQF